MRRNSGSIVGVNVCLRGSWNHFGGVSADTEYLLNADDSWVSLSSSNLYKFSSNFFFVFRRLSMNKNVFRATTHSYYDSPYKGGIIKQHSAQWKALFAAFLSTVLRTSELCHKARYQQKITHQKEDSHHTCVVML